MTFSEFEKKYTDLITEAKDISEYKQEHYGDPDDVFRSIKDMASLTKQDEIECMYILLVKHIVSLKKIMREYSKVKEFVPTEIDMLKEKVVDMINYLVMLYLIVEKDY